MNKREIVKGLKEASGRTTGKAHRACQAAIAALSDEAECATCGDTGKQLIAYATGEESIDTRPCPDCNGTGKPINPVSPMLTEEQREALEAGETALSERGEFHIYKDGKVYTRAECVAMARVLHKLAAQPSDENLVKALEKDAARYRALRSGKLHQVCGLYVADGGNDWRSVEDDELDRRIDAAHKKQVGGQ